MVLHNKQAPARKLTHRHNPYAYMVELGLEPNLKILVNDGDGTRTSAS